MTEPLTLAPADAFRISGLLARHLELAKLAAQAHDLDTAKHRLDDAWHAIRQAREAINDVERETRAAAFDALFHERTTA